MDNKPTSRQLNSPSVTNRGEKRKASVPRTWMRLAVGTLLSGYAMVTERTEKWQEKLHEEGQETAQPVVIVPPGPDVPKRTAPLPDTLQVAVGLLSDAQFRYQRGKSTFQRLERLSGRISRPLITAAGKTTPIRALGHGLDRLAARGQQELNYWMDLGKIEGEKSQELFTAVTTSTLNETIDYLSTNPDVQELVQTQSTSLLNEVIEELRERTVSLNTVIEGWIRKTLGLIPREDLPGPKQEVRQRAYLWQPARKKAL